jgi:hypothetical protein
VHRRNHGTRSLIEDDRSSGDLFRDGRRQAIGNKAAKGMPGDRQRSAVLAGRRGSIGVLQNEVDHLVRDPTLPHPSLGVTCEDNPRGVQVASVHGLFSP